MSELWSGNESDMHRGRIEELKLIEPKGHHGLNDVISLLLEWEESSMQECLERERHEAIFGELI